MMAALCFVSFTEDVMSVIKKWILKNTKDAIKFGQTVFLKGDKKYLLIKLNLTYLSSSGNLFLIYLEQVI